MTGAPAISKIKPPLPAQRQQPPGSTDAMKPVPDHGETGYVGSGRLKGKRAVITGGDSGIGRAVAIAFAREGADVLISYLCEHKDAADTAEWVEKADRTAILVPGDISQPTHCRKVVAKAVETWGKIDVLVNNAARQRSFAELEDITDREWEETFATNIHAMFYLAKAALPHMEAGASIINTSSINADKPNPTLLPYATTKGAIQNFTSGLAQLLADREIRVNCVAPGPVWTPLIPATMPPKDVQNFAADYPLGRPAQPAELAPAFVMLASDEASYISGATIAMTGGKPLM